MKDKTTKKIKKHEVGIRILGDLYRVDFETATSYVRTDCPDCHAAIALANILGKVDCIVNVTYREVMGVCPQFFVGSKK